MPKHERKEGNQRRQGPLGDVIPTKNDSKSTGGGQPAEEIEDRPTVGSIKPEGYPKNQRARS